MFQDSEVQLDHFWVEYHFIGDGSQHVVDLWLSPHQLEEVNGRIESSFSPFIEFDVVLALRDKTTQDVQELFPQRPIPSH